jgi:glycerophosphoryl diester phosphodiesterase
MKVVEVVGHQGSCADRPDNTLAGVRRALEAGAHVVEVDVRTTKHGVLVCLHDAEVDRTTDGKGKVADPAWAEVKTVVELSPDGRYPYYLPGAHGGAFRTGTEVVQYEVATGRRKVLA